MPVVRIGKRKGRVLGRPIYGPDHWGSLPSWVLLHAERGSVRKCWEGHRLKREKQKNTRSSCNTIPIFLPEHVIDGLWMFQT